ncbi:MAG: YihY/virulence factor BrkB family protein [Bryobacteraceae bacterium]|nr:YihY/virulence factor BrkB family protein [Bryobacteraceae bacterium]
MAANVLLSFFPLLIVMISICRYMLGWKAAEEVILVALQGYFPDPLGSFIRRNLLVAVGSHGTFPIISLLLLLYTANGIFLPLEVALNRAWGIARNRNYVKNQVISFLLTFATGLLILTSVCLGVLNRHLLMGLTGADSAWAAAWTLTAFKAALVPITVLLLILIYRVLPNGKVSLRAIVPVAIVVGLALEALKYLNVVTWPWLRAKLALEYGPFVYSVTIVLWGFLAAMVVLAGAEWAARAATRRELQLARESG